MGKNKGQSNLHTNLRYSEIYPTAWRFRHIYDYINQFSAQEVLDACYTGGEVDACQKIHRIGGDLTIAGSGIDLYTTNLKYQRSEGIEIALNFGIELGDMGDLSFGLNANKYLKQESQSADLSAVIDCKGYYGTDCSPVSDLRWVQRTTWTLNDVSISAQWRHSSAVDIQTTQTAGTFEAFRQIDSYDYVDLFASYHFGEHLKFTAGIDNVFDKNPPVVGNEAGTTSFNSGNTFPSTYDTLGRIYKFGVKVEF